MPEERALSLDTGGRHNLLSKARRGLGLWWRGEASLRRVANAGLCNLSLRWRLSRVLGRPYFLMIEPTNACNLRCPLCPTGRGTLGRPTAFLPLDSFRRCIAELGTCLIEVNVSNYGEPMLHKDLSAMIACAKAAGARVSIGSNGLFLNDDAARQLVESGLDLIYISFDGVDQETYAKYRVGGSLQKVIEGVKALLAQRKALGRANPFVELQFLVMKHNESQLDAFRKLADELGADRRVIKPVSFNVADWDDPATRSAFAGFFPDDPRYQVYRREGDAWLWRRDGLAFCTAPWRSLTVLADGRIVPCCRDPRGHYAMGSVADGVLKVWNGPRFRKFRKALARQRAQTAICRVCPGE
ncbi:MAG: radical SAM protein [Planctomycetes bacterium]|nr:radical SAM protein [Planctomycetota bacterium]